MELRDRPLGAVKQTVVVVPCWNEARRLDGEAFLGLAARSRITLCFVDDGSTDETATVLRSLAARGGDQVAVLPLSENRGKAEAVRRGLLAAIDRGADVVGYADADLSTPPAELARLIELMAGPGAPDAVLGSRVALLGADIRRKFHRHLLGRVFATGASLLLRLPVYDTQCGAKLFRAGPALRRALDEPFRSRWAFDVELLGRLLVEREREGLDGAAGIVEVPLRAWTDVPGSKLSIGAMAKAAADLAIIAAELRRRRR